jgi:hypothetical protein
MHKKSDNIKVSRLCDLNEIAAFPLMRKSLGHSFMAERCVLAELYVQVFPIDITHQAPAVKKGKFPAIRRVPDHQIII